MMDLDQGNKRPFEFVKLEANRNIRVKKLKKPQKSSDLNSISRFVNSKSTFRMPSAGKPLPSTVRWL